MKLGGDVAVTRMASLWAPISGKSDTSDHRSQRGIRPSTRTRHGHRIAEQAQDGCVKPGDGRQAARSALTRRSLARPVHRPGVRQGDGRRAGRREGLGVPARLVRPVLRQPPLHLAGVQPLIRGRRPSARPHPPPTARIRARSGCARRPNPWPRASSVSGPGADPDPAAARASDQAAAICPPLISGAEMTTVQQPMENLVIHGDRADRHVHVRGRVAGDELRQRQWQDHRPGRSRRLRRSLVSHGRPSRRPARQGHRRHRAPAGLPRELTAACAEV